MYLTVETIDQREITEVFAEAIAQGLPVFHWKHVRRGGCHYYPPIAQVIT